MDARSPHCLPLLPGGHRGPQSRGFAVATAGEAGARICRLASGPGCSPTPAGVPQGPAPPPAQQVARPGRGHVPCWHLDARCPPENPAALSRASHTPERPGESFVPGIRGPQSPLLSVHLSSGEAGEALGGRGSWRARAGASASPPPPGGTQPEHCPCPSPPRVLNSLSPGRRASNAISEPGKGGGPTCCHGNPGAPPPGRAHSPGSAAGGRGACRGLAGRARWAGSSEVQHVL